MKDSRSSNETVTSEREKFRFLFHNLKESKQSLVELRKEKAKHEH